MNFSNSWGPTDVNRCGHPNKSSGQRVFNGLGGIAEWRAIPWHLRCWSQELYTQINRQIVQAQYLGLLMGSNILIAYSTYSNFSRVWFSWMKFFRSNHATECIFRYILFIVLVWITDIQLLNIDWTIRKLCV